MMREHYKIADLLIKNGANVHAATVNNSRPLHFAATSKSGSPAGIKLLIKNNAEINVADEEGETPLFRACIDGFSDRVELLLKHGADVKQISNDKVSPLYWPSVRGHIKVIELLIKHGADVNNADISKEAPLHGAAAHGQINATKLLLKNGADINKIDEDGETPLFKALKYIPDKKEEIKKYIETAKFLIEAMLEQNPRQEKPKYIEQHKDLSAYWDEQIKIINLKIDYLLESQIIGSKNSTQNLLNKGFLAENNSLFSLSFHQFFKLLNPEAIKKIVSNKTDNSEVSTSSSPGFDK